ncbi:MAG: hypothetical protein M3Y33_08230 [Actinomycetota bacterium]|nr:hypothetical protein [Actinomycetota bacterium]
MTYRVEFEGDALERLNGLPRNAFDALVESVVGLVRDPWNANEMAPSQGAPYREAFFGDYGLLSFRVDERTELIRIFGILWAG